jgi:hypothetical protein
LVVKAAEDYALTEATVVAGRLMADAIVPVVFKDDMDPKLLEISFHRGVTVQGKLIGPDGQPVQGGGAHLSAGSPSPDIGEGKLHP